MADEKTYRTVTDVLNMPAGESEPLIMRAAPAIARVADSIGVLDTFFDRDYVIFSEPARFAGLTAKERERIETKVLDMGKDTVRAFLSKGLGECLPDVKEIIAAINGMGLAELNERYTTLEVIAMAKAVITDQGFLSFAATLTGQGGPGSY